jgi:hypothetical protein
MPIFKSPIETLHAYVTSPRAVTSVAFLTPIEYIRNTTCYCFSRKPKPKGVVGRVAAALIAAISLSLAEPCVGASHFQGAPLGSPGGAPGEFSSFTTPELMSGFLKLAFGSDMQSLGSASDRIHKFDHQVHLHVANDGSVDRSKSYQAVVQKFVQQVNGLDAVFVDDTVAPDIIVRFVDARNFNDNLAAALGNERASNFITQTNPRCTTRMRASDTGTILRADIFIIVDQGEDTFLDCAYHETLHALGLMNHANDLPWTTLNQNRKVGYLSIYDRTLLKILYDSRIRPGMTRTDIRGIVPKIIPELRDGVHN